LYYYGATVQIQSGYSLFDIYNTHKEGIENIKTIDSNDDEASQTNSDTSDQLTDALKNSLADVIDENLSKDLQKKIAQYVNAISKNLTDDEKTKLLDQQRRCFLLPLTEIKMILTNFSIY